MPMKKKSSMRDIPVTRSGLTLGIYVTCMIIPLKRFFMDCNPRQVKVAINVDISADNKATIKVTLSALKISEFSKSFRYQSNVKPPQTALDLASLKEKIIKTITGA
jgi:hypothetical protein